LAGRRIPLLCREGKLESDGAFAERAQERSRSCFRGELDAAPRISPALVVFSAFGKAVINFQGLLRDLLFHNVERRRNGFAFRAEAARLKKRAERFVRVNPDVVAVGAHPHIATGGGASTNLEWICRSAKILWLTAIQSGLSGMDWLSCLAPSVSLTTCPSGAAHTFDLSACLIERRARLGVYWTSARRGLAVHRRKESSAEGAWRTRGALAEKHASRCVQSAD